MLATLLTLACVAYIAKDQISRPPGQFLQYDELFFSSCAAREVVGGWASVAGCHDNKAPVILLTHALIAQAFGPYNAGALKVASAVLFALLTAAGSFVASRMSPQRPRVAALSTAVLLVLALMPRPATLAMKTELMGAFFVLAGSVVLLWRTGPASVLRGLLAGSAMGLAMMSKQTYVLIAPVGLLALLLSTDRSAPVLKRGLPAASFLLGLALPAVSLAALYGPQGKLNEFVFSTFVYPAFYGGEAPSGLAHRLLWIGSSFGEMLRFAPTHVIWALLALPVFLGVYRNATPPSNIAQLAQRGWLLMGGALLASLAMIAASPLLFESHPIPFWVFSSVLGGAVAGRSLDSSQGAERHYAQVIVLAAAIFGLALTVRSNGGQSRPLGDEKMLAAKPGTPIFVLGMAPEFYAYGRFTPASSILYPWAFPNTPRSWAFLPPAAASTSPLAMALRRQQQLNVQTLYKEFAATPPHYIVVFANHARQPDSPRIADVPGLDGYIQAHCRFFAAVHANQPSNGPGQAFECTTP